MSEKENSKFIIENAFKISNNLSISDVYEKFNTFRKEVNDIANDSWLDILSKISTAKYDLDHVSGQKTDRNYINEVSQELIFEINSAHRENRASYVNIMATLYFTSHNDEVYGFLYTHNKDYVEHLYLKDDIEKIEPNDSIWEEIFKDETTIPNERFFSLVIIPNKLRLVDLEDVALNIPSRDERLINTTRDYLLINKQKAIETEIFEGTEKSKIDPNRIGAEIQARLFEYASDENFPIDIENTKSEISKKMKKEVTYNDLMGAK